MCSPVIVALQVVEALLALFGGFVLAVYLGMEAKRRRRLRENSGGRP